jgi:putative aldouronate transport system permease protein
MTEKLTHGEWMSGTGSSSFTTETLPRIFLRLLCFVIFPVVPVGVFLLIVSAMNYPGLLPALIAAAILCFACGPAAGALRVIERVNGTTIDGARLAYKGELLPTALFFAKTAGLSAATLGLYWLSGLSNVAAEKYIWERTERVGSEGTGSPYKSGFIGNFLHITFFKLIVVAVPVVILCLVGLIPVREHSQRFWEFFDTRRQDLQVRYNPKMQLWPLAQNVVYNALARRPMPFGETDGFYNEVTTLLWAAIILAIAAIVLVPWYRSKMLKWQTEHTVVDGCRFIYSANFTAYFLLILRNAVFTVFTLGLWVLLGFNRASMVAFRVSNTHLYIPPSAQASLEAYMVQPEKLTFTWRDKLAETFNPAARRRTGNYFRRYWTLYLLLLTPIVYLIIFKYIPMLYIQIGAKINNIIVPVWDVPWGTNHGFEWFIKAFQTRDFYLALRNTLMLNGLDLLFGFPAPIILAILLNELSFRRFKRVSQTIFYMPHFLSWVIIASLALQLFNPSNGLVNVLLESLHMRPVNPFNINPQWVVMYVVIGIWQGAGWGTIIYLAAITNINPELYEAAVVDGAGRWRKIWHITLPGLRPTIIILFIMRMGSVLGSDFERAYALRNPLIQNVSDNISIFVYLRGLQAQQFSLTSAVGIFQSVVCLIFLFAANFTAKRFGERGVL